MSETVRDAVPYPKGWRRKYALAVLEDLGILDAHIYGSGTDIYWSGTDSISVVATEVREKAARAIMLGGWTWEEADEASRESCRKAVDAVLEVVLGQVRVAKDVLELRGTALGDEFDLVSNRGAKLMHLTHGDTIAILED